MTNKEIADELQRLYMLNAGAAAPDIADIRPLPQGGGDRRYYRISGRYGKFIGTYTPDSTEGKSFVELDNDFHNAGCEVPQVFTASPDFRFYLQEDLGDTSLFSLLGMEGTEQLVRETLVRLVKLQKTDRGAWLHHCATQPFCRRQVMWDLNYFKYEFLKPSGVLFDESFLEDDFEKFSERLISIPDKFWGFMMRDCQSRNVMSTPEGPKFIDFQGGRLGPSLYDAVSLLWQARANFSVEFRNMMLEYYADFYCKGDSILREEMLSFSKDIILFRTLQVLGAYGFRGLVQRRAHFLVSIPSAIENLSKLIDEGSLDRYPQLKMACKKLCREQRFAKVSYKGVLTVEIFSFSYKKGYPEDLSGNGGGYMFDCRAMHNPGRYKEYKTLTGRDKPVIDFLEERGEVFAFLQAAWAMTDPAVERYLSRGFSKLQIGFGCTGGQHRSVYCAETTARHIMQLFPEANVSLIHREHPQVDLG